VKRNNKKQSQNNNLKTKEVLGFKPSLSTKILSINDFITRLLSKLLRNLSKRVHLKSISNFINKVINRYCYCKWTLKTGPFTKILSFNNFVNKLVNNL
jgi:hypothetical protein